MFKKTPIWNQNHNILNTKIQQKKKKEIAIKKKNKIKKKTKNKINYKHFNI